MPRATRAAAAIQQQLGTVVELVKGSGGIYEVAVDGRVVIAKGRSGFPSDEAVVAAVKAAVAST